MGGTLDATSKLIWDAFHVATHSLKFEKYETMLNYFYLRLKPGSVERFGFGYLRPKASETSINGHLIGLKVWKTSSNKLFVRGVDFQQCSTQRLNSNV